MNPAWSGLAVKQQTGTTAPDLTPESQQRHARQRIDVDIVTPRRDDRDRADQCERRAVVGSDAGEPNFLANGIADPTAPR